MLPYLTQLLALPELPELFEIKINQFQNKTAKGLTVDFYNLVLRKKETKMGLSFFG